MDPVSRQGVPLSATADSFETFVYRIPSAAGSKWWPTTPDSATVAFTVVGSSSLVGVNGPARQVKLGVSLFPSPTTRRITLNIELPVRGRMRATIVDVTGREVARVADDMFEAGDHQLRWDAKGTDGRTVTPGVYLCLLDYAGTAVTRKFVLVGGKP